MHSDSLRHVGIFLIFLFFLFWRADRVDDLHEFDPETMTWRELEYLSDFKPTHRSLHAFAGVGRKLYTFGGETFENEGKFVPVPGQCRRDARRFKSLLGPDQGPGHWQPERSLEGYCGPSACRAHGVHRCAAAVPSC